MDHRHVQKKTVRTHPKYNKNKYQKDTSRQLRADTIFIVSGVVKTDVFYYFYFSLDERKTN